MDLAAWEAGLAAMLAAMFAFTPAPPVALGLSCSWAATQEDTQSCIEFFIDARSTGR